MKKLTQIFILFIVIIIISFVTFVNIFKETFNFSQEEQNIINNLTTYNNKLATTNNLLSKTDPVIDTITNYKTVGDSKVSNSAGSLTKINSTNLTLKNQIDIIQEILGGGSLQSIKKLGIVQNVQDNPIFSAASLLTINDKIMGVTPAPTFAPTFAPINVVPVAAANSVPVAAANNVAPVAAANSVPIAADNSVPFDNSPVAANSVPIDNSPVAAANSVPVDGSPVTEAPTFAPDATVVSPFMYVSKELFTNLLNSNPIRKPVEHFADTINWRDEWNAKLSSISQTKTIPLSNTTPKIDDNETSFYIIQNPNLEKNLEDTSSNIIKIQMKNMTEILRDKWIKNNRKY
jgi:hypothetical protein